MSHAGTSRGQDVKRFNESMVTRVAQALSGGDVHDAWATYSAVLGARRASNMRIDFAGQRADIDGTSGAPQGPASVTHPLTGGARKIGGYEGVALRVIDGLSGAAPARIVVNTRNGPTLGFLDADDVVEVPALVDALGIAPLANTGLEGASRGLVLQVKEYERAVVDSGRRLHVHRGTW